MSLQSQVLSTNCLVAILVRFPYIHKGTVKSENTPISIHKHTKRLRRTLLLDPVRDEEGPRECDDGHDDEAVTREASVGVDQLQHICVSISCSMN